ncbi:methyltransferase [Micromonospora sp. NPDC000442]|uniref:methyltransferase n=1 Tax=Micromonospora sp. NPDC000442 TaxID=3364217 RepID=UPI00367E1141
MLHEPVVTDPTELYRLRDGVYAADLLIVVVAELDLFTWLDRYEREHDDPAGVEQVCGAHQLDPRAADVTITYLVARGLLARVGDRIVPTRVAREHLVAGSPYDLRAYYASLRERPTCRDLLAVLRSGRPAAWAGAGGQEAWSDRLASPEFAASITAAMDARGAYLGPALAEAIADLPARAVLDVGGGSGIYGSALVQRLPGLRVDVLERPPVDGVARTLLATRGYADRVGVVPGDMFAGLPGEYDAHLYSHVLHDWGAGEIRRLLANSAAALPPGGWVVVHDTHINDDRSGPLPVAEYSVLLMHSTPGKCWSVAELRAMFAETGFDYVDCRPTAADRTAVIGRRARR